MTMTNILLAFLAGGAIASTDQIFIDKTNLTPARLLVFLVSFGVFLYAVGAYEPLFEIFGCGVSVPLIGFGATIARGVKEAIDSTGALGILTGGLTAGAAGITLSLMIGLGFSLAGHGKRRNIPKIRR